MVNNKRKHLPLFSLLAIMLFLIIPAVSAKEVFNDWVQENEGFNVSGREYMVGYYPQVNKISLSVEGSTTLIGLEDCEWKDGYEYCFDEVKNDTTIVYVDIGSYQEAREVSELKVRISELAPKIAVSTSADVTTLSPGEETKITATISNNGDKRSDTIVFRADFPSLVEVKSSFLVPYMNAVKWEGKLNTDEEKTITYRLLAKEYGEFKEVSTIEHGGDEPIKSSERTITIIPPYEVSADVTTDAALMNASVNYTLTFENKHSSDVLKIKEIFVIFPEGLKAEDPSGFRKYGDGFIMDDEKTINGNNDLSYTFTFQADAAGDYIIKATSEVHMDAESNTVETETAVAFGTSKSVPILNVTPTEVDSFNTITIVVELENKDVETTITDVEIDSNLFDNILVQGVSVGAGKKKTVFEKNVQAPEVAFEKTFTVTVTSKQDVDGETVTFTREATVTVSPRVALVRMDKEIEVVDGDVEVSITVSNPNDETAKSVEVVDIIPKNILIIAGSRVSSKVDIGPGETVQILNYTLRPTDAYLSNKIEIDHTLNARDADGDLFVLEDSSLVYLSDEPVGNVTITTSNESNSSTSGSGSGSSDSLELPQPEKKPGAIATFFKKIKDFIKGLFN